MVSDPQAAQARFCKEFGWNGPVYAVSALDGTGTQDLIWALQDYLDDTRRKEQDEQDKHDGTYVFEDPRFDTTRSDADTPPPGGDE